jgi:hypothetical protein
MTSSTRAKPNAGSGNPHRGRLAEDEDAINSRRLAFGKNKRNGIADAAQWGWKDAAFKVLVLDPDLAPLDVAAVHEEARVDAVTREP